VIKPLHSESIRKSAVLLRALRSMFLNVGGIAPLGAILMGKGAQKAKWAIGERKNTKRAKVLND